MLKTVKVSLAAGFSIILTLLIIGFTVQTPRRFSNPPTDPYLDFWNIDKAAEEPLNIEIYREELKTVGSCKVRVQWLKYTSEHYGGFEVRINGFIAQPADQTKPLPAVLMLHGTNGSSRNYLNLAVNISSRGYVVMAIDAPGCGESSREPACTSWNIVNVSNGPKGAYYYHASWSAIRAVTLLTNMDYVDGERIAVAGASMGGIETYMVAAVDPRVKAAIPIVSGGNYRDLIMAGSLANLMAPKGVNLNSEAAELMVRSLDVYLYAAMIRKPILMLVSTNDEFFTLHSINDTFSVIPYTGKLMNLASNWGHSKPYRGWVAAATLWLDSVFKGGKPIPKPQLSYRVRNWIIEVETGFVENYTASVVWRNSIPGSLWTRKTMVLRSGRWVAEIETVLPSKVFFYIALELNGVQVSTSPVYEVWVNPPYLPVLLLVVICMSLAHYRRKLLRPSKDKVIGLAGWLLTLIGLIGTHIVIPGRAELTLWDLLERYGLTVGVNPWLTCVMMIAFALQLTMALLKPKLCWTAASINLLLVFAVFNIIQNVAFRRLTIAAGYGLYMLLAAVAVHAVHSCSALLTERFKRMA